MNFHELYDHLMLERLLNEALDNHQPKDGHWEQPLGSTNYAIYRFNVEGDPCGTPSSPCYAVKISGDPSNAVSISFNRGGSYSDQHKGVGLTVFKGVLKALGEYIEARHPAKLIWSAVSKNVPNPQTGKIVNPEARAHVYEGWATRHLFPDKYVGMEGQWIRRDIYDRDYAPNGYPPVPEDVTADSPPAAKAAALEHMKEKARINRDEIQRREVERQEAEYQRQREEEERRRQEEIRRRQEEERLRQERLQAALADPQQNPEGLKVDDVVYVMEPHQQHWEQNIGKITEIKMGRGPRHWHGEERDEGNLYAQINYASDENDDVFSGYSDWVKLSRLRKESPEAKAERERVRQERLASSLADPQKNPNGVREGDEIFSQIEGHPDSAQNGLLGRIRQISKGRYDDDLYAHVDWDAHAQEVLGSNHRRQVSIKHLKKASPEALAELRRQQREHEIEQMVQRSRERQDAGRSPHEREGESRERTPEEVEAIANHPANPQHLKPGDYVCVRNHWRHQGRCGILVDVRPQYYNPERLDAYVRFHGSRAASPQHFWDLDYLERDTSPEAEAMQQRIQARQARSQRIQQGAGAFNIGDRVTVASGVHRGKQGRIISFRTSGQNVTAVVATMDGTINVRTTSLAPPVQQPAATPETPATEWYNLSFTNYLRRRW